MRERDAFSHGPAFASSSLESMFRKPGNSGSGIALCAGNSTAVLVLNHMFRKFGPILGPTCLIKLSGIAQTIDRPIRHRECVVRVIVSEQSLAPERQHT